MLKVTTLFIAAAAALGMSSAFAQSDPFSPGGTRSGWSAYTMPNGDVRFYAGGQPIGGFSASQMGNTTKFNYAPLPTSPAPVTPTSPSAGNYTTLKRLGDGFTLEQKADIPVPGRNMTHPVALRKNVPPAAMAKALGKFFAKGLPIAGAALALPELLEELFPNDTGHSYDSTAGVWTRSYQSGLWRESGAPADAIFSTPLAACVNWLNGGTAYYAVVTVQNAVAAQCEIRSVVGDSLLTYVGVSKIGTTTSTSPVTPQEIETAYPSTPTPPIVDAVENLLPYMPEPARKDLAQDSAGPGISVIPYTPDGQPSFEPWTGPETSKIETTTHDNGRSVTTISRTKTTGTPVQDGIRYDTTTTTTTTSQTTDPVTGSPQVDPVTGEPVTETTTTTTTTEQTPSKPAEGEDLECGLPGTPPCKIDEGDTPSTDAAEFNRAEQEIEDFKSGLLANIQAKLDEILHEWTWTFQLPTGCASLMFDTLVGKVVEIDMCQHQPMIHDIMSMVWAAAGVWGALMIFLRANG